MYVSPVSPLRSFRAVRSLAAGVLMLATLAGCAVAPYGEYEPDPAEPVNRIMYGITDLADRVLLEPVADLYLWAIPGEIQIGVSNFFDNIGYLDVIINDFLQGKVEQGFSDAGRFALNSTVGFLGIFDVATVIGLPEHDEDLGQTFGVWGLGEGPYLFVPFYGPHNARDVSNIPMGMLTNPLYYSKSSVAGPLIALSFIDKRARLKSAAKVRDEAALDPYVFTREAYRQNRRYKIYDGQVPALRLDVDLDRELEAELNGGGT